MRCGLCGREATGFASAWEDSGEVRYCHGDDDPEPTCYERRSRPTLHDLDDVIAELGIDITEGD